ncbi:ProQ/FINO family protein [Vibrio sp. 10N.222.55.C6]|uniref:ProQ/FINO family protein n=1 Tax=Vibrio sp. 10N.222.55.C6 TaxID=3229649 RepID=UPI0035522E01
MSRPTLSLKKKATPAPPAQPTPKSNKQVRREVVSALFKLKRPFAIGITEQLIEAMPDVDVKHIKSGLACVCGSYSYLQCVTDGKQRYNLDGTESDRVTHEARVIAIGRLNAIRATHAAQKAKDKATRQEKHQQMLDEHARRKGL